MKTKKLAHMSLLIAYSLILYIIESYIPNPLIALFPGAKLGLTNIITLVSLSLLGFKDTFIIITVRVILSSIFAGPISYLLFSISGAYLSLLGMSLCLNIKGFSMVGVSILGAICHNIGQLIVASLIIESGLIFTYLPYMLIASIPTGVFVGMVSNFTTNKLSKINKRFIDSV